MKDIRHIFFDLDHTLWDFDRNSQETLGELLQEFILHIGREIPVEEFYACYDKHNRELWRLYRHNRIDVHYLRSVRFRRAFDELGVVTGDWVGGFDKEYVERCPKKSYLMPSAIEVLTVLKSRYEIHIVTNGFSFTQDTKLTHAGLKPFIGQVITSESAGAKKPDPKIFAHALEVAGAIASESLFVGDSYEADVEGSLNAGMEVVFFNPDKHPNPLGVKEVQHLEELLQWL